MSDNKNQTTGTEPALNKAAALKYDGKNAPKIVAKGSGSVAQKIIDIADEHNVHIHNDPLLLEVLSKLELGDEIPEQLYLTVAKVIAFAYFLQGKHPEYSQESVSKKHELQLASQLNEMHQKKKE